jgi:hypothetical protein
MPVFKMILEALAKLGQLSFQLLHFGSESVSFGNTRRRYH